MTNAPSFRDAMRAVGLEPPGVIEPGRWYRFPGLGKRKGNAAGWCILFKDRLGGCFGDWSSDITQWWRARPDSSYTPPETATLRRRVAEARTRAAEHRQAVHAAAAARAVRIWYAAQRARMDHRYLTRKRITPNGARQCGLALILPIQDFRGKLASLQFIRPDGTKRLLRGGRKLGFLIHVAGPMKVCKRVVICEGWATGCTLAEHEPASLVLAAIDAGNLKAVALAARCHYPSADLVIAGDDDRLTPGNPGATKAKQAAIASGALLALPKWPVGAPETLTDFNDLAVWREGGAP